MPCSKKSSRINLFIALTCFFFAQPQGFSKNIKILDFSRPIDTNSVVILGLPTNSEVNEGSLIKTFRDYEGPLGKKRIPTGLLSVVESDGDTALARIKSNGTVLSQSFFPKFPKIMVGDVGELTFPKIKPTVVVTPIVELPYHLVFVDPLDSPHTFELTDQGKAMIRDAFAKFTSEHIRKIMIEGYTDDKGPKSLNQVESYQRALAVRQFALNELNGDPLKLEAVGFGETNLKNDNYVPDYRRINRRIVIKALPRNEDTLVVTSQR